MALAPEITNLLSRMTTLRIEEAHHKHGEASAQMDAKFAARNVLGSGFAEKAKNENLMHAFAEAANGVSADYLSVAADGQLNADQLREVKEEYFRWLDGLLAGLRNRFPRYLGLVDQIVGPARTQAE